MSFGRRSDEGTAHGTYESTSETAAPDNIVARFVLDGAACVVVPQANEAVDCCLGRFEISGRHYAIVQVGEEVRGELLDLLTPRELEIALLIASGQEAKAVARRLHISFHTVRVHVARIYCKLGMHKQTELAALISARYGVVPETSGSPKTGEISAALTMAMCAIEQWQSCASWALV
ncbi:MAG TPA: helix-turn-helix transcriptional regulator [Acetobacteraceae bacterium]|jgi:DNA-binding CsgD family transcriptional regulator|nr:helix-turn-helix transcriptional regulator [Acetobacteraceae bacterium]